MGLLKSVIFAIITGLISAIIWDIFREYIWNFFRKRNIPRDSETLSIFIVDMAILFLPTEVREDYKEEWYAFLYMEEIGVRQIIQALSIIQASLTIGIDIRLLTPAVGLFQGLKARITYRIKFTNEKMRKKSLLLPFALVLLVALVSFSNKVHNYNLIDHRINVVFLKLKKETQIKIPAQAIRVLPPGRRVTYLLIIEPLKLALGAFPNIFTFYLKSILRRDLELLKGIEGFVKQLEEDRELMLLKKYKFQNNKIKQ